LQPRRAGNRISLIRDTVQAPGEREGHPLKLLPRLLRRKVLVGVDSGGGTREFLQWLTAPSRRLYYSADMTITQDMQAAIGEVPAAGWTQAYDDDGQVRDGAWVADITGLLDLAGWRAGPVRGPFRCAKDTGLRNLPLKGYAQTQFWCEIAALACELIA
jgi:hypothetical protein